MTETTGPKPRGWGDNLAEFFAGGFGLAFALATIACEIAWLYGTISGHEWFWLAIGFAIPPVGTFYGALWLIFALVAL